MLTYQFPYNPEKVRRVKAFVTGRRWDGNKWWTDVDSPRNHLMKYNLENNIPISAFFPPWGEPVEFYDTGLWDHQKDAVESILPIGNSLLLMDTRTGKTRVALEIHNQVQSSYTWWVLPKSAKVDIVRKLTPEQNHAGEILFLTYEQFTKHLTSNEYTLPKLLILDEIHKVKADSNRGEKAREAFSILSNEKDLPKILGLTATPTPKSPTDWWGVIEAVRPAWIPYRSRNIFEEEMSIYDLIDTADGVVLNGATPKGIAVRKIKGWHVDKLDDFIKKYVDPICFRANKYEVFPELLPPVHKYHDVPMSDRVKKFARKLRKFKSGNLIQSLRQLSDGFLYINDYDEEKDKTTKKTQYFPDAKLTKLRQILEETQADRPIVFAGYTASIDSIYETLKSLGYNTCRVDGRGWSEDTEKFLNEFDETTRGDGKYAICGHPKSLATGLELSACKNMIYYSHTDDGESEFQSVERAQSPLRKGQLIVHHLIHLPTDKKLIKSIKSKSVYQDMSLNKINLEELREILEEI